MIEEYISALKKKALGNEITTVVEDFVENDKGKLELVKKTQKTTKNDIDTQALLKLIEIEEKQKQTEFDELKNLSDDELQQLAYKLALQIIEDEQARRKECSKKGRTKK